MDSLEMPISLPHMSLAWERKPGYQEETPKARAAQGGGGNQTPTSEM